VVGDEEIESLSGSTSGSEEEDLREFGEDGDLREGEEGRERQGEPAGEVKEVARWNELYSGVKPTSPSSSLRMLHLRRSSIDPDELLLQFATGASKTPRFRASFGDDVRAWEIAEVRRLALEFAEEGRVCGC